MVKRNERSSEGRILGKYAFTDLLSVSRVAIGQGLYYFIGGVWPLVSTASFLAVTGPKTDLWLMYTVGLLLAAVGGVLIVAGLRRTVTLEVLMLAVWSASVLAGVEVVYVLKGRISLVYLLDAFAELGIIYLWGMCRKFDHSA